MTKQRSETSCIPQELLVDQLVQESVAMAKYAFASGIQVPGKIIQVLESYSNEPGAGKIAVNPDSYENETRNASITLKNETQTNETPVSAGINRDIRPLVDVHDTLVKIVEPAKPRTILLIESESHRYGKLKFLGSVTFIRRMMLAALICLVMFIAISLSPSIGSDPNSWNLFKSSGWELLLKELFLLSAAGLGASFTALFKANRYIIEGTFDPKYESSYWIRFSLGFIAGMILATLIPIEQSMQADFGKPLLAMLGGFSADLVYRIIHRVIDTLEALFKGDTKNLVQAQKEHLKVRSTEKENQNRFKLASRIMKVRQEIKADTNPEDMGKKMDLLLDSIVGTESSQEIIS